MLDFVPAERQQLNLSKQLVTDQVQEPPLQQSVQCISLDFGAVLLSCHTAHRLHMICGRALDGHIAQGD